MEFRKMSGLARPIDWNYPTNRLIIILTVVSGILFGVSSLVDGNGFVEAGVDGFWTVAAMFSAWALAREIDPDHEYSAFIGAVAAPFLVSDSLGLSAIAMLVLFSRLVSRSTGFKATLPDSIALLVLVTLALFISNPWVIGLMATLAFLLDARMENPNPRHLLFAGIALLITAAAVIQGSGELSLPDGLYLTGSVVITIAFLATILTTRSITTLPDYRKKAPLDTQRVQATMGLVLLGTVLLALWEGNSGVNDLIPVWAAMAGVSLYRVWKQVSG